MSAIDELRLGARRAPRDREVNLVFADALAERGDPRGELAHLHDRIMSMWQAGEPPARIQAGLAEARALLQACLPDWLGFDPRLSRLGLSSDGRLVAQIKAGYLYLRWSLIVGYDARMRAGLSQIWAEAAMEEVALPRLEPGELRQLLEAYDHAHLRSLALHDAALDAEDEQAVARLRLDALTLAGCRRLDDRRFARLGQRNLTTLSVLDSALSPAILSTIQAERLRSLRFTHATRSFLPKDLRLLGDALEHLELHPADALTDGLGDLSSERLKTLILSPLPSIDDAMLDRLAALPALNRVQLTAEGTQPTRFWVIESDDLTRVDEPSGPVIRATSKLTFLRGLTFQDQADLDDERLFELRRMTSLQALQIQRCPQVRGAFLADCLQLRSLELLELASLSESTLIGLEKLPHLQALAIRDCPRLTGDFLTRLRPEKVTFLDVRTIPIEIEVLHRFDRLNTLGLGGPHLNGARLEALVNSMPQLQSLSLARSDLQPSDLGVLLDHPSLQTVAIGTLPEPMGERFDASPIDFLGLADIIGEPADTLFEEDGSANQDLWA